MDLDTPSIQFRLDCQRELLLDDTPSLTPPACLGSHVRIYRRNFPLAGYLFVRACDAEHAAMIARRLARYNGCQTQAVVITDAEARLSCSFHPADFA